MIGRNKIFIFLYIALSATVFIFAVNNVQKRINRIKIDEKLTDADPVENAPPIVAFTTVALGSFRGLVADILWLRSVSLQDKGQYFEMVQLASWITKLQPRFTGATAYLAWNMAYNISVTFSSWEDRWRWVRRGIELIRDEALEYNPADPILYKELGWIYQHKLGNVLDDANLYYKNQMSVDLMKAFGGGEPDWEALAATPVNENDFKKKVSPKDSLWKILADSGYGSIDALEKDFKTGYGLPPGISGKLDDGQRKFLDSYFRKRLLKSELKLDPVKIVELNSRYGKLDWRLPEAHAIYWATLGMEHDRSGEANVFCERMITQSLKDAFMGGKLLVLDRDNRFIMTVPNLKMVDAVKKSYENAYETHKSNSFKSALENFLKDAVVLLYTFGSYSEAQKYLEELRRQNPDNPCYKRNIDAFVLREWTEDIKGAGMKQAMDIIGGLIFRSCYFYAYGEIDEAASHERIAALVYETYRKAQGVSWGRVGLPPYSEMKDRITKNCCANFPKPLAESLKLAIENEKKLSMEKKRQ